MPRSPFSLPPAERRARLLIQAVLVVVMLSLYAASWWLVT